MRLIMRYIGYTEVISSYVTDIFRRFFLFSFISFIYIYLMCIKLYIKLNIILNIISTLTFTTCFDVCHS